MKRFRIKALVKTAVGAQGYLYLDGQISDNNVFSVDVYRNRCVGKSVEELLRNICDCTHVELLEPCVCDFCIQDVQPENPKNGDSVDENDKTPRLTSKL